MVSVLCIWVLCGAGSASPPPPPPGPRKDPSRRATPAAATTPQAPTTIRPTQRPPRRPRFRPLGKRSATRQRASTTRALRKPPPADSGQAGRSVPLGALMAAASASEDTAAGPPSAAAAGGATQARTEMWRPPASRCRMSPCPGSGSSRTVRHWRLQYGPEDVGRLFPGRRRPSASPRLQNWVGAVPSSPSRGLEDALLLVRYTQSPR